MAKIAELLAAGPTRSYEFFPPKNDEMERQLDKAVSELAPLGPSFVSVTYGALGSTRERTRDVVIRLNGEQTFPCMAHLTCVGHTRGDIAALLDEYADSGVENILALGGDPPADGGDVGGDFTYAVELVEIVRAHPAHFGVGVAAHPELHPRSADRDSDRRHLAEKLALADFGVTQFFFIADEYLRMIDELSALGCDTPVIPGIMPVQTVAGVKRMAAMNGSAIPPLLLEQLEAADGDPATVISIGVDAASELAAQMIDAGAPGLHLYALNRSESVRRIYANLGLA
ncbi:MAG: methylenetetrahydrofolate reductase [Acidimicrobiaceae bacterium]|jgi:methylenetetrahydrofolate reductase (NADPH)